VAASLLTAADVPELIARDLAEYEALALRLATTPVLLGELRARLARNRTSSALFDTATICKRLEAAYEAMRRRVQRFEVPAGFDLTE
jgi:protein O-GlcNAc transferase